MKKVYNTSQWLLFQIEEIKCLPTWTACDWVSYWLLRVCLWVTMYDNVHMHHSNSEHTSWVGGNEPVHVGKEDKQVKQHCYVTKLYRWRRSTILSNDCCFKLNRESVYLHGRHVTDFLTNCCVFAYEWHCMTMCTCIILIVNLHPE